MENKLKKYNIKSFLLFNSENFPINKFKSLSHFALTDALINYSGMNNQAIIHFWQTPPLVILGGMDTKINFFKKAIKVFKYHDYKYIVRNSGGLAVISDPGILNLSLIYPGKDLLSIDEAYKFMLDFIRETFYPNFPNKKIEAFKIYNSYCFGDYDLSINGKKFAGISQRRTEKGIAIMIYISINENQNKRTEILKKFYKIGLNGSEASKSYPTNIKKEAMTSLEKAYQKKLTTFDVKNMMLKHLNWSRGKYNKEIMNDFYPALDKIYKKNVKFLGEKYVESNLR